MYAQETRIEREKETNLLVSLAILVKVDALHVEMDSKGERGCQSRDNSCNSCKQNPTEINSALITSPFNMSLTQQYKVQCGMIEWNPRLRLKQHAQAHMCASVQLSVRKASKTRIQTFAQGPREKLASKHKLHVITCDWQRQSTQERLATSWPR